MSITVKLRKNGRIVIPQATREMYDLQEGDLIDIELVKVKKKNGAEVQDGGSWLKEHGEGD